MSDLTLEACPDGHPWESINTDLLDDGRVITTFTCDRMRRWELEGESGYRLAARLGALWTADTLLPEEARAEGREVLADMIQRGPLHAFIQDAKDLFYEAEDWNFIVDQERSIPGEYTEPPELSKMRVWFGEPKDA